MNPAAAQAIGGYLMQSLQSEYPITKKVLAAVPDAKLSWRPHEKGRTAGELAWHIAVVDVWFLESIVAGKFHLEGEPKPPPTTVEIVSYYEKNFPAALAKVQALPVEALSRTIEFLGVFNYPAFVYLGFTANHSIHHRGQLSAYLRAMGEKVPSIYGGSADEPFVPPKAQAAG